MIRLDHRTCLSFFGGLYHSDEVQNVSKARDTNRYGVDAGNMLYTNLIRLPPHGGDGEKAAERPFSHAALLQPFEVVGSIKASLNRSIVF